MNSQFDNELGLISPKIVQYMATISLVISIMSMVVSCVKLVHNHTPEFSNSKQNR